MPRGGLSQNCRQRPVVIKALVFVAAAIGEHGNHQSAHEQDGYKYFESFIFSIHGPSPLPPKRREVHPPRNDYFSEAMVRYKLPFGIGLNQGVTVAAAVSRRSMGGELPLRSLNAAAIDFRWARFCSAVGSEFGAAAAVPQITGAPCCV